MHIFAKAIMVLMEKLMNVLIDEFSVEELPYHVMKVSVNDIEEHIDMFAIKLPHFQCINSLRPSDTYIRQ